MKKEINPKGKVSKGLRQSGGKLRREHPQQPVESAIITPMQAALLNVGATDKITPRKDRGWSFTGSSATISKLTAQGVFG